MTDNAYTISQLSNAPLALTGAEFVPISQIVNNVPGTYKATIAAIDSVISGGVTSLNAETGAITLIGGSNVTISGSGQNITITGANPGTGTVTSVSGTTNRITSTGGTTPVIDISASYVGQSSITTLGTITTGTWNGVRLTSSYIPTDVAYTDVANTFTVAPQTISIDADSHIGMIIKGHSATQSGDLQEWQKSDGTVLSLFNSSGILDTPGAGTNNLIVGGGSHGSVSSGVNQVILGYGASQSGSTGQTSVIIGRNAAVTGTHGQGNVLIGDSAAIQGYSSVVVGASSSYTGDGNNGIVIGASLASSVGNTILMGSTSTITNGTFSFGYSNTVQNAYAMAFGGGITTDADGQIAFATPGADADLRLMRNSSTTAGRSMTSVKGSWVDSTDATRKGRLALQAYDFNAVREGIRIEGTGNAAAIGFYGAAAIVQPSAITAPSGGAVIDIQARAAITSILNTIGAATGGIGITA